MAPWSGKSLLCSVLWREEEGEEELGYVTIIWRYGVLRILRCKQVNFRHTWQTHMKILWIGMIFLIFSSNCLNESGTLISRFLTKLAEKNNQEQQTTVCDSASDEVEDVIASYSEIDSPEIKRKKIYKQKFKPEWKTKFKWLDHSDLLGTVCSVCHLPLKGGVTHFERHENTTLHNRNLEKAKKTPKITEFCKPPETVLEKSVKRAETKLVAFLHEHNLPFLIMDHLILLLASIFPDSEIARGLKCGRTKSTKITKDCLAAENLESLTNTFQNQPFSLIIDETTDIGTQKSLVLVARYFNQLQNKCKDIFIGLLRIKECNAQSLFNAICDYLVKLNIPLDKLMGLAADNASVMMGNIGGVQALFRKRLPNIFVLGCVCHSFHLCSSAAAKKLPRSLEDFIRSVYKYFSHSSKRQENLQNLQKFVNLKPHKILHPSQTRWLSLQVRLIYLFRFWLILQIFQAAVDRILENWTALTLYFRNEYFEDDLNSTKMILDSFQHPTYKIYFTFLSYILDIINKLNLEFQGEKPKIFNMTTKINDLYRGILRNYIKKEYIDEQDLKDFDPKNPKQFLPLESMYFGANTELLMAEEGLDLKELHNFRLRSLDFYIELASQIKKRFNFSDPVLDFLKILNPSVAVSGEIGSIILPVQKHFPHLVDNTEKLNSEWRMLADLSELKKMDLKDFESFWSNVFSLKNELEDLMFPNLKKLLGGLLSLPHSSAAAERIFSQVTLLKTKIRNRLEV